MNCDAQEESYMSYTTVLDAYSFFFFFFDFTDIQQPFLFSPSFSVNLLTYCPFLDGGGFPPDPGTG